MRSMGQIIEARTKRKWRPIWRAEGEAIGEARGEAKGECKGRAAALLKLLAARGVDVDDSARERIATCRDVATLDLWFERALVATRLADVLDRPAS
jgi:hypothetical protein